MTMKRLVSLILVLVMVLSMLLVSCNTESDEPTDKPTDKSTEAPTDEPTEKPTEPATPDEPDQPDQPDEPDEPDEPDQPDEPVEPDTTVYTYEHSYIDADVFAEVTELYEGKQGSVAAYWLDGAPYVLADVFGLSNSTLKSITIPVLETKTADADGNFVFTISVFKNDLESIKISTPKTYAINISAEEYGLEASAKNIYKMITVDLASYEIKLAADECIAVATKTDTLVPAYLPQDNGNTNPIYNLLKTKCPQMLSFSMYCGKQAFDLASNTLLYNFTYERTYIGKASYDAAVNKDADFATMLEKVKNEYKGLNLSVFGDSISTYYDISNNTSYNSTIGSNLVWYSQNAESEACLYDHTYTYWGSMLRELGMDLCVNNSWSGDSLGSGKFKTRAEQLHTNEGKNPDVIVVYFGINDTWGQGRNVGELLTLIENKGDKETGDVVEEWCRGVLAKDGNCTNWDELYATLLFKLMDKYPSAKIVCIGLAHNGAKADYPSADKWVPLYNESIRAITDCLDITYVDQSRVITNENCHAYMHDTRYLHPNAHGHRLIFEEIVRTLYEEIK